MSVPTEPTRDRQLVALARSIEVLGARRRRLLRDLRELDEERKRLRKLLDDMLQPELLSMPDRGPLPNDPDSRGRGVEGPTPC
jgi:predicted  nucleic acid-binding Zn-ribbon protein